MKGLIVKELIMFRKSWLAFTILIGTFAAVGIFSGKTEILLIVTLFMSAWSVSFMNMDEVSKWQQYAFVLPYGRRKIVSSKYVMMLILNAVSVVLITVCYLTSVALGKTVFSAGLLFNLILMSLIMGIAYSSFLLPLIYKLNTEKGRILLMIANGTIGGISSFILMNVLDLGDILGNIAEFLPLIVLAVVAVLFVLSWLLSVKIYEKRDF